MGASILCIAEVSGCDRARSLVLELHARRAEGVFARRFGPVRLERGDGRFALGAELVFLLRLGAVAAARDDERACALRVADTDVQGSEAAHRKSDDVRPL